MKKKLRVICEGKTEVQLVNNLLHDRLSKTYSEIIPITLPTGQNPMGGAAKGGFRRSGGYAFALKHILNSIKMHKNSIFTTFFDLYEFPSDIDCYADAKSITDPIIKAAMYEKQMGMDVIKELEGSFAFLPYVQPYESEAFLFVNPLISAMEMGDSDRNVDQYESRMAEIRHRYLTPEHINASKGPSKHLEDIFPNYRKNKAGRGGFSWMAAKEIGLNAISEQCEHFREWIYKLESF